MRLLERRLFLAIAAPAFASGAASGAAFGAARVSLACLDEAGELVPRLVDLLVDLFESRLFHLVEGLGIEFLLALVEEKELFLLVHGYGFGDGRRGQRHEKVGFLRGGLLGVDGLPLALAFVGERGAQDAEVLVPGLAQLR